MIHKYQYFFSLLGIIIFFLIDGQRNLYWVGKWQEITCYLFFLEHLCRNISRNHDHLNILLSNDINVIKIQVCSIFSNVTHTGWADKCQSRYSWGVNLCAYLSLSFFFFIRLSTLHIHVRCNRAHDRFSLCRFSLTFRFLSYLNTVQPEKTFSTWKSYPVNSVGRVLGSVVG